MKKLVGFLDYETKNVYVEEHKKYNAEVFLQFLKNVLSQYPSGKIVMIKAVQKFIDWITTVPQTVINCLCL